MNFYDGYGEDDAEVIVTLTMEEVYNLLVGGGLRKDGRATNDNVGHPDGGGSVNVEITTLYPGPKAVPLSGLVGKSVAAVSPGKVHDAFGEQPTTVLHFTDGTSHEFVHPRDEG